MTIEQLLYTAITSKTALTEKLTTFDGKPAVFFVSAPMDADTGWASGKQYPRIDYTYDKQANPERHTQGNLYVNIWSGADGPYPEELEPLVRAAIDQMFIKPDGDATHALAWVNTDGFEAGDKTRPITGATLVFDIFEMPAFESTNPDPIHAIWDVFTELMPEATVIARDALSAPWWPSIDTPAVYARINTLALSRALYDVSWYTATVTIHVIAASKEQELTICRSIMERLAGPERVLMRDESPLLIEEVSYSSAAGSLDAGQIGITASYGVPRTNEHTVSIMNVNVREEYHE